MIGRFAPRIFTVAFALAATPVAAQGGAIRTAHEALARGDYARAERVLVAERRIFPGKSEVTLNLAAVYARTDRAPLAVSLYERVLADDDVLMDIDAGGTVSAHRLAKAALRRLQGTQTALR